MITIDVFYGLMIPFLGTTLGAAAVFFMKKTFSETVSRALMGFAAGVMAAASVWSLILPAIEQSQQLGALSFLPSLIGFWLGILFLFILDRILPLLQKCSQNATLAKRGGARTTMMVLAVTLHNIPEGMAVGIVYAGFAAGTGDVTLYGALALALGIAIQNIPEGAIISMPLQAQGKNKAVSFFYGMLSGAVEPLFGALTVLCAGLIIPAMPYLLSFAAGAMMYVVVEELIPEMKERHLEPSTDNAVIRDSDHGQFGVLFFTVGFTLMMAMDVALG